MFRPTEVQALPNFHLKVRFEDGVEGVVDLSPLAGKGVFASWNQPRVFDAVSIGAHREIRWSDEMELCPDAIYLQITGLSVEEAFGRLVETETHA